MRGRKDTEGTVLGGREGALEGGIGGSGNTEEREARPNEAEFRGAPRKAG